MLRSCASLVSHLFMLWKKSVDCDFPIVRESVSEDLVERLIVDIVEITESLQGS